ncbi:phosphoribosylglycinamide formyltransferase [Spiribacter vilamensis]|uniref:Phosphoribosylglycinamide formyltransferase n=1 Tax=Spiribacter vilamensis TaxID=531306 RepID=A0A4Q8D108_9GAMM|nr:phosphoribosylglycinamide formyltransferase [Spiribacter vilamensis]RZU98993.1 formyltetrahydrofolate-dependent phosphoribosylglycinamide formyltransferase [Spiribacter vilamensis]TVO62003.1 phosphoribosylglycinamide formyltransferase [Spiribacter vilamensis]
MSDPEGFRIAVLISGGGTNLQAIIDAIRAGSIPATITRVISNRPAAGGLDRAAQAGIATDVIDHRAFSSRAQYDAELAERLDALQPDLIVLAGFMRILGDDLVDRFSGRLINIHPSLLPAYRGLRTHERALEAGEHRHGCSVHYVIPELDAGPVIAQAAVAIEPGDTAETLARRVQAMEHRLYPEVVRWIAEGRVALDGDRVRRDGDYHPAPPCLTETAMDTS